MLPIQILEAAMLACFGLAWPLANLRMLRTRRAEGRGLAPTGLVFMGYSAGLLAKLLLALQTGALAPVFWMYLVNAGSVLMNLYLQWHFRRVAGDADDRTPTATRRPAGVAG